MGQPNDPSPLDYELPPQKKAGNKVMKTAGLLLILTSAAYFVCSIVGIIISVHAIRISSAPNPNQLALGISRSLCFSVLGIIFLVSGAILRSLGSRKQRKE